MSYVNEAQLVQAFANRMERQLAILDHGDELEGILIGHELTLPSAGAGGNAGSLDLLLLEPSGELWAIEAKLSRNSQSNPEYVFGNQLKRYAISMMETPFLKLHRYLESFAFGHRVLIKPAAPLAELWVAARSLEDMIRSWLILRGHDDAFNHARHLTRVVEQRLRTGNFVCGVLTDEARLEQGTWIDNNSAGFPLALLELNGRGEFRVLRRPQSTHVDLSDESRTVELPPFLRVPGTYQPLPSTLPRILNEWAYELYDTIVRPRTIVLVGKEQFENPKECDHASFRFRIPLRSGAPVVLEVGRGAERHMGSRWMPASTSLRINVNLLWSVSEAWRDDDMQHRNRLHEELWALCSGLIEKAGYHIKGGISKETFPTERPATESRSLFDRRFDLSNELILERKRVDGTFDLANRPEDLERDRESLVALFDVLETFLAPERPLPILKKVTQVKRTVPS